MKIVAYYRIRQTKRKSTTLDLESQQAAVKAYAKAVGGKVVADFKEFEELKVKNRPQLDAAIKRASESGATLVVAKVDRLVGNFAFTATLRDAGIDFVACDNTYFTPANIKVITSVAETQAIAKSRTAKDSLAAVKAEGTKLGSARPGHWKGRENKRGWKKGAQNSAAVRSQRAASAYAFLIPRIKELKDQGLSLNQIAEKINSDGHLTTAGKPFTPVAIYRLLQRYAA